MKTEPTPYVVRVSEPEPALAGHLKLGGLSDVGATITTDARSLWRDGRPWFPVMGEFHYARYPRAEWERQLRAMRAGGIGIVGTYVFWLYHEEIRGQYRWDDRRDLRAFVELCADVGLEVVARIGPWGHGEARNGGFPDWLVDLGLGNRTDDPAYLDLVRDWYAEIARHLDGLWWKHGGPVIAVQIENELYDQPGHLLTLKQVARRAGFTAPLWTATGWGRAQIPQDEFIPLFGGYPEAAWDEYDAGPAGQSRLHYFFTHVRDDFTIGADLRTDTGTAAVDLTDGTATDPTRGDAPDGGSERAAGADPGSDPGPPPTHGAGSGPELSRYPFATCELGGGMYVAYHRRPRVPAADIAALSLVKLGCGSTWQGYYMYHGGTHLVGELSTTQESHATSYPNDCPVLTYDFQAPLGEFGQVRPAYGLLRRQALWVAAERETLARMVTTLPADAPSDIADTAALRWCVRSDGVSGYLFVNNHQPGPDLPAHPGVRFRVEGLTTDPLLLPRAAGTVPSGAFFAWPLRLDVAGAHLSATAELVTRTRVEGREVLVLAATGSIPVELHLEHGRMVRHPEPHGDTQSQADGASRPREVVAEAAPAVLDEITPGRHCRVTVAGPRGEVDVIVLDAADAAALAVVDDDLWLCDDAVLEGAAGPEVATTSTTVAAARRRAGGWDVVERPGAAPHVALAATPLRPAGTPRRIPLGGPSARASAPVDADFAAAAAWQLDLGPAVALLRAGPAVDEVLLRIDYIGDVARLYARDRLLADHFWYGDPWDVGLRRFADVLPGEGLRLEILPLAQDAPIHFSPGVLPPFTDGVALDLRGVVAQQRVVVPLGG